MNQHNFLKQLFFMLGVLPFSLLAQPIIDGSVVPEIGDVIQYVTVEGVVDVGDAGENVTWIFENLTSVNTTTYTYLDPLDTPFAADYLGSNLAVYDGLFIDYYLVQPGSLESYNFNALPNRKFAELMGLLDFVLMTGDSAFAINDFKMQTELALNFPMTYEDNLENSLSGGSFFDYYSYDNAVQADAYGTLFIEGNEITDVLRLKSEGLMDMDFGDIPPFEADVAFTKYEWYKNGTKAPIVSIVEAHFLYKIAGIVETDTIVTCALFNTSMLPSSVGIAENPLPTSAIQIYPNPALRQVTIELQGEQQVERIEFLNIMGQTIHQIMPKNQRTVLDVSNWQTGVYMVRMMVGNEQMVKRLVIK